MERRGAQNRIASDAPVESGYGREVAEAHEHWTETFFRGAGLETVRDPERERTAPLEADWALRVLALRSGDRLLDIPCGTGRMAAQFAAAGIRVLGIDRCARLIEEARRRVRGLTPPPVFRTGDMLELDEPPRFEAAVIWWNSFGYFSDEQNLETVRRVVRALRPGGRFLVDTVNREHVRRHTLGIHDVSFGRTRFRYTARWDGRTERLESDWEITDRAGTHRAHTSIRLYTPGQMRALGRAAGLEEITLFGDWTGSPYRRGSYRLIMYGRRPAASGDPA